jgi:RNA polymerase sigma factor (sigma-70 family)
MSFWRNSNQVSKPTGPTCSETTTDSELVRAAIGGDKQAFVTIVARHQAMVCGITLTILGDFAESEDAAQETFVSAWRKLQSLRDPGKLRPWLAQIARNAALEHLRQNRHHFPLDDALLVVDGAATPDKAAAREEEAAMVRDSLAKLPETYRLPLILYYREDQSVRAVAEALSVSEDAVKQRLARGREMLREEVSELIETVLTRTGPTAVFTVSVAAAIGALAAPAALASSAFATTSASAGPAATSTTSTSFLTAMSTTTTSLITATLVAALCIPVGYYVVTSNKSPEGDEQIELLVNRLLSDRSKLLKYDKLIKDAPDRLRMPLIEYAFKNLHPNFMTDPQTWIARVAQLPETSQPRALERIAQSWTLQTPGEAAAWTIRGLPTLIANRSSEPGTGSNETSC